jgi:hypothetical protein
MKPRSYDEGYWDTDSLIRLEFSAPMIEALTALASQRAVSMKNYEKGCEDRILEHEKYINDEIPTLKSLV